MPIKEEVVPHALTGRKADTTIISGYTGVIDDLLRKGILRSQRSYSAQKTGSGITERIVAGVIPAMLVKIIRWTGAL